jgi:hypothetical protein
MQLESDVIMHTTIQAAIRLEVESYMRQMVSSPPLARIHRESFAGLFSATTDSLLLYFYFASCRRNPINADGNPALRSPFPCFLLSILDGTGHLCALPQPTCLCCLKPHSCVGRRGIRRDQEDKEPHRGVHSLRNQGAVQAATRARAHTRACARTHTQRTEFLDHG